MRQFTALIRSSITMWLTVLMAGLTQVNATENHERPFKLTCADGFVLDGKIQFPAEIDSASVKKVIILIHGSGPQSMDEDISPVTKGGKKNLFFKDLSEALAGAGFAVVRYHKRSYQMALQIKKDPAFKSSPAFQELSENPMKLFVEDVKSCVEFCKENFPTADIFLLGHSQGTYVALQVAHQKPEIKGVALIGLWFSGDLLFFEQTIYRKLHWFETLDKNENNELDAEELAAQDPVAATLRSQLAVLDLDGNKRISRMEFQAGNFANLLTDDPVAVFRKQEAMYPSISAVLKAASFKVAVFQGLLDNQTPAYQARAVELVVKHVWKKENFRFTYFPGLGHALDPRQDYYDLQFDTMAPAAKEKLAAELAEFF